MKAALACLLLCLSSIVSHAHEASTSYLYWHPDQPDSLRLDIALTDLMVHFSTRVPEQLHWGELQSMSEELGQHLLRGLTIQQGTTACPASSELVGTTRYTGETFGSWLLRWRCPSSLHGTTLSYRLLFAQDSLHRAVLIRQGPFDSRVQILAQDTPPTSLKTSRWGVIAWGTLVLAAVSALVIYRLRRRQTSAQRPHS